MHVLKKNEFETNLYPIQNGPGYLVIIAIKTWKQPICPSVGEWINWYIQMIECYSLLKRNELSNYEKTWRNLKCILLHERSQHVKALYCMIPTK